MSDAPWAKSGAISVRGAQDEVAIVLREKASLYDHVRQLQTECKRLKEDKQQSASSVTQLRVQILRSNLRVFCACLRRLERSRWETRVQLAHGFHHFKAAVHVNRHRLQIERIVTEKLKADMWHEEHHKERESTHGLAKKTSQVLHKSFWAWTFHHKLRHQRDIVLQRILQKAETRVVAQSFGTWNERNWRATQQQKLLLRLITRKKQQILNTAFQQFKAYQMDHWRSSALALQTQLDQLRAQLLDQSESSDTLHQKLGGEAEETQVVLKEHRQQITHLCMRMCFGDCFDKWSGVLKEAFGEWKYVTLHRRFIVRQTKQVCKRWNAGVVGKCFAVWQQETRDNKSLCAKVVKFAQLYNKNYTVEIFTRWKGWASLFHRERLLVAQRTRQLKQRLFDSWKGYRGLRQGVMQSLVHSVEQSVKARKTYSFNRWRTCCAEERIFDLRSIRMERRITGNRSSLYWSFHNWRGRLMHAKSFNVACRRAHERAQGKKSEKCFAIWKRNTTRCRILEQTIDRAFRLCEHMPHSRGEYLRLGWAQWRSFVSKQRLEEIESARDSFEEERNLSRLQHEESLKVQQNLGLGNAELERLRIDDQRAMSEVQQQCKILKQSLQQTKITIRTAWVHPLTAKTFARWKKNACQMITRRLGQSVTESRAHHERVRTMTHIFRRWMLLLNWGYERRHLFQQFRKRFEFRFTYKVFKSWKSFATQRRLARRLSILMTPRFSGFRLNFAMFAWKLYVKHTLMTRRILLPLLKRLHHAQLHHCYSKWRYATFVLHPSEGNFVRENLRAWHIHTGVKKRYRALRARLARAQNLRLKASVFHGIFRHVAVLREQNHKIAQTMQRWESRGVREAFRKLRSYSHSCLKRSSARDKQRIAADLEKIGGLKIRMRTSMAVLHTFGCVEFFFRNWVCETERRKRRRRIVLHYANKAYLRTVRIATRRWHRNLSEWFGNLEQHKKAVKHSNRVVQRVALRQLSATVRAEKSRRGAQYRVVRHFQHRHLRKAYRTWGVYIQWCHVIDTQTRIAGMAPRFTRWCVNVSRRKIARRLLRRLIYRRIRRQCAEGFQR
jgi:hypothetical protein